MTGIGIGRLKIKAKAGRVGTDLSFFLKKEVKTRS
jgi:hypothetical protein